MNLFVQEKYSSKYSSEFFKKTEGLISSSVVIQKSLNSETDVIIADLDFIVKQAELSVDQKLILISSQTSILSNSINGLPIQAVLHPEFAKQDQLLLQRKLEKIQQEINIKKIKNEIQSKRKVLEKLNEQLQLQSNKKLESLVISHEEETKKNQNEKMLLHFLEFIRTESLRDDFISLLLKFLWKDFKKIGHIYQIGFCVQSGDQQSYFIKYDGEVEKIQFASESVNLLMQSKNLATLFGRPVGKIINWHLPEFSKEAVFYIELVSTGFSENTAQHYLKERLTLLSLYLDRWMIEKEYKMLVEKWDHTFAAFQGLVHVVDENYVIQKSNYLNTNDNLNQNICYKVLARRSSPCLLCPIGKEKSSELYLSENKRVKANSSTFELQGKKYHFVFYEDLTQLDQLKTQIIQSERMSALGRLGNYLSHEINNPLTGLKSYIQLIQAESKVRPLPTTLLKDLEEVLKATLRSEKIVANLQSFTQENQVQLEVSSFKEVWDNTLTLLKTALRNHRLFVDLKIDPILVDRQGLQQVIFNLIKNSCQALSKEGIIKVFQEDTPSEHVYTIEDNGPGLKQEIKENLFLPFMTTKKEGEGTGLGLYLSKRILERMNARLKIDTESPTGFKAQLIFKRM